MKKTTTFLSVAALVVTLTACSDNSNQEEANGNVPENEDESVNDYGNNNENNQSNYTDGEQVTEEATNAGDAEVNDSENESSETNGNEQNDGEAEQENENEENQNEEIPLSYDIDDDVMSEVQEKDIDELDYAHPHGPGRGVPELDRFKDENELQMQLIKSAYQDGFYDEEIFELFHDWEEDVSTSIQDNFMDENFEWTVDDHWVASASNLVGEEGDIDEGLEYLLIYVKGNEENQETGEKRGFSHGFYFIGEEKRMNLFTIRYKDELNRDNKDFH